MKNTIKKSFFYKIHPFGYFIPSKQFKQHCLGGIKQTKQPQRMVWSRFKKGKNTLQGM